MKKNEETATFVCPKCGGTDVEALQANAIVTTPVWFDGDVVLHKIEYTSIDDCDDTVYRCVKCGMRICSGGEDELLAALGALKEGLNRYEVRCLWAADGKEEAIVEDIYETDMDDVMERVLAMPIVDDVPSGATEFHLDIEKKAWGESSG